ncbi:replicative DNA helicase (plasmid) [Streptomyces sp. RLB1-9]|uniref:replicative DNA helicase n=1 Tax=Streptomyces sp. RLB1-9 TaxID=2594454 RepID=UPI001163A764|nr:replicative DNA helicase [Streptomyces sp. RLB1-9]QDN94825.1 replicative DNA helicase [Streptomyces sp. RLB1-9]
MSIPQQTVEPAPGQSDMWQDSSPVRGSAFERIPPQDLEAEQCVLGGMLLSRDAIEDVLPVVKAEKFAAPKHETIFRAILDVYGKGDPVDPITVADELTKRGELNKVGGAPYLHTLVQFVPTAANAEYYAEIVHEKAVLRQLAKAGRSVEAMAYAQEGELAEICNRAQNAVYVATEVSKAEEDDVPIGDVMEGMLDELEARQNKKGELTGVPTGLMDVDSLTEGLQPGQMIVIAARPAVGKSTLAVDFARSCSIKHGLPSQIFSLEMGRNELSMRIASAEAKVALHHMRSGNMTEEDWTRLARRMPDISAAPLFIDDSPNITLNHIRSRARKRKAKDGLSLIIVDYIQLMESGSTKYADNRQQQVSDISRGLKLLAKELEVPVIALSQLNRESEKRSDKKPVISDLRESGAIEQDADVVILLHRDDVYEKESPRAGEADLIVAKHRNGPTATISVAFQGHYCRFVDMAQT